MDRSSPAPSSSKAPAINGEGGFRPQANMAVQPPRQEDLQRSYASIVGTDADAKGWYGSMSTSQSILLLQLSDKEFPPQLTRTVAKQSTALVPVSEPWAPFHAALSARTHTRT